MALPDPFALPQDLTPLAESFQKAQPVPFICLDGFLREDFAREVAAAYPAFERAREMGREFRAVNELRKVQVTDPTRFPEPVARLHRALASPAWLGAVSTITGIPDLLADEKLEGGGMHLYAAGARLDVHIDFNRLPERGLYRRLNILVFLNPRWEEGWGGEFELWDPVVKVRHQALAPVFNRCVIFATSEISYHGVLTVRCPEGTSRNSFAGYYYTEAPPSQEEAEYHSTVFKARPNERLKGHLWMPLERLARRTRERGLDLARRTYRRLRPR